MEAGVALPHETAAAAVRKRTHAALLLAFVEAAHRCAEEEARGDVRDGWLGMPLPFRAAELVGADADVLVQAALPLLDEREAALLAQFAARPDRASIGGMGWREVDTDEGIGFVFGPGAP